MIGRPWAATTIRAAADATAASWLRIDRTSVSSTTASAKVPVTVNSGEYGKNSSPSAVAVDVAAEAIVGQESLAGRTDDALSASQAAVSAPKRKFVMASISRPVPATTP